MTPTSMFKFDIDIDIDAVIAGESRLTRDDALRLYHEAPLHDLGQWANAMCERIHGDTVRTYVIDRNINYTNVCSANCTFCAFKRDLGDGESSGDIMPPKLARELMKLGLV